MLKRHVRKKIKRKRKERCIPKEGMPHAHKACQKEKEKKEKMHTKRRYATCSQGMSNKKKEEKEKDSPYLEK